MMRRALLLLALVACSKTQAAPTPPPAEASVAVVVDAAPAVDAAPPVLTASFAHFIKGNLYECVEMTLTGTSTEAGDPFAKAEKQMKDAKRIDESCSETFADRQVLATCTIASDVDGGGSAKLVSSFYDFADVGLNDKQMAECLEIKGRWKAIPRDSKEWHKAKLEHDRKRLGKAVDKLNEGKR